MKREKLKELRISRGLTQKEMGKQLGYSRVAYTLIENGETNPHPRFWKKLRIKFKIPPHEMGSYMKGGETNEK